MERRKEGKKKLWDRLYPCTLRSGSLFLLQRHFASRQLLLQARRKKPALEVNRMKYTVSLTFPSTWQTRMPSCYYLDIALCGCFIFFLHSEENKRKGCPSPSSYFRCGRTVPVLLLLSPLQKKKQADKKKKQQGKKNTTKHSKTTANKPKMHTKKEKQPSINFSPSNIRVATARSKHLFIKITVDIFFSGKLGTLSWNHPSQQGKGKKKRLFTFMDFSLPSSHLIHVLKG